MVLKATVHLMQMGLAILMPLMGLLPLDVTGLCHKSILGAVTLVMALPRVPEACLGLLQPFHVLESTAVTFKALILCHDLVFQQFQPTALILGFSLL